MDEKGLGVAGRRKRSWKFWLAVPLMLVAALVAIPLVLVPLYWVVPPVSTLMVSRYVTGQPVTRVWRDIDEISDRLKTAVVLSEDGQFCSHHGVDVAALRAEIDNFLAGKEARGASTITMQVARNLFLWNDRSVVRKVLEVPLAVYIDLVLPKRRIMEIYLNIAEWGPDGQFGVEAGISPGSGPRSSPLLCPIPMCGARAIRRRGWRASRESSRLGRGGFPPMHPAFSMGRRRYEM
jgi:monofunctional biosynthetic peptidoglycan transglycosylase